MFRGSAGLIRVVFQCLGFQVIQVCLQFFGFVSSFGVVWRFRVVELCSGFSRVVSGCLHLFGVWCGLRLFGVQVCSGLFMMVEGSGWFRFFLRFRFVSGPLLDGSEFETPTRDVESENTRTFILINFAAGSLINQVQQKQNVCESLSRSKRVNHLLTVHASVRSGLTSICERC